MSQLNHDDCWIPARDTPDTKRRVIIWTKHPWSEQGSTLISRHLDMEGAWYNPQESSWYHSDGSVAEDVTHWMEMPTKPK